MSATPGDAALVARATIAHHSKSFALASKLLPPESADDSAVVYTWCRWADDAVDEAPLDQQPERLEALRVQLQRIYDGEALDDVVLAEFQRVVRERGIPREYPGELLAGMAMDVEGFSYRTLDDLLLYCHRVAGVVGLMMCHVLGVRDAGALRNAAHLGIAMQLTNICRDVLEDWERGRLYLPDDLLARCGAEGLRSELGAPLAERHRSALARALRHLLELADRYYRSGDEGLFALPWRAALAVRTARSVYSRIGRRIAANDYDVFAGRAVVPRATKLLLALGAVARATLELPGRALRRFEPAQLDLVMRYPSDVLPI